MQHRAHYDKNTWLRLGCGGVFRPQILDVNHIAKLSERSACFVQLGAELGEAGLSFLMPLHGSDRKASPNTTQCELLDFEIRRHLADYIFITANHCKNGSPANILLGTFNKRTVSIRLA